MPQLQLGDHAPGAAVDDAVITPEDAKSLSSNSTYANGSSRDLQSSGEEIKEDGSDEEQIPADWGKHVDNDGDIFGYKGGSAWGDGDYAMEEYSINQHIRHFLGRRIDKMNRECVEICLLIKAGTAVTNKKPTSSDDRNAQMLERYIYLVHQFKEDDFVEWNTKDDMAARLFKAKHNMNGNRLWGKLGEWRKDIHSKYSPKFPKT